MLSFNTIAEAIGNSYPKYERIISVDGMILLRSPVDATITLREARGGISISFYHKVFGRTISKNLDVASGDADPEGAVLAFLDECEDEAGSIMDLVDAEED